MNELTDFQRDTAAAPLGEGRFLVSLNDRWWIGPGPNGGYVAALMLEAMTQASAPGQPARSLTVHFLRRPVIGEAEVHVTVERAGHSTTFISSRMLQEGRIQAQAMAVFSADREGPSFDNSRMPEAIPPEEGVELDTQKAPVAVFNQYRAIFLDGVPYSHGPRAETSGWVRLKDDQPMTAVLAAAMLDVWFPAPFVVLHETALAPTLEYTVHFNTALPATGRGEPDWSLVRLTADQAREGHFSEDGELWSRDGRLLARSRQIALLREPRKDEENRGDSGRM
ncbi:MAG: thioesterase family protein [Solirubrobacterales bacterium]|nr:thioesterase family protein [Solirubrobacterales bacterium]